MSEIKSLNKGDTVWTYQVEKWGDVADKPHVMQGVVTGGGPYQVLIQWEGEANVRRYDRSAKFYPTKLEALQAARQRLASLHLFHIKRVDKLTATILMVQEMLDAESGMAVK